jgi:hypothetical protein
MEALEVGARLLLIDEDTAATNFMIRSAAMQVRHAPGVFFFLLFLLFFFLLFLLFFFLLVVLVVLVVLLSSCCSCSSSSSSSSSLSSSSQFLCKENRSLTNENEEIPKQKNGHVISHNTETRGARKGTDYAFHRKGTYDHSDAIPQKRLFCAVSC